MARLQLLDEACIGRVLSGRLVVEVTTGHGLLLGDGSIGIALEAVNHASHPRAFVGIRKLVALGASPGRVAAPILLGDLLLRIERRHIA